MKLSKDVKEIGILILFILVFNLFFINKAFHIDDISFLYIAKHMVNDPFHPYSFDYDIGSWSSAFYITDPPLIPFYYSFFIKFFNESEIVLHLSFLLFTLLALVGMYYVAKRFTSKAFIATFLLIVMPVFFLMSHNVMVDIPTLGFFLAAVALYVHGVDRDSYAMLFLASIFVSLGLLTKYTSLVLIPLLGFYSILKRKYSSMLFLLIPLGVIFLWVYYTTVLYGTSHLGFVSSYVYKNIGEWVVPFFVRAINVITNLGGAIILPIFLFYPFVLKRKSKIAYLASILLALFMAIGLYFLSSTFVSGRYSLLQLTLFFIFVSAGLFSFYLLLDYFKKYIFIFFVNIFKRKNMDKDSADKVFLFAWFIGIVLFNVLLISYASRYILLLVPAFIIFYVNILSQEFKNINLNKIFFSIICTTFILSLLMAINDYQLANSYRKFATSLNFPEDKKIWYNGHHGFKYYMDKQGYEILKMDSNGPKKGDIIIKSVLQNPKKFSPDLQKRMKLENKIYFYNKFPIRVFSIDAHAGFYSYGAGFLPFSISTSPLDVIEIYEVIE